MLQSWVGGLVAFVALHSTARRYHTKLNVPFVRPPCPVPVRLRLCLCLGLGSLCLCLYYLQGLIGRAL